MVGTTLKMRGDENALENINQVQLKKLTVPTNEATTKRAALGDLQNRGLNRAIAAKDVAQKELKESKLPSVLRNAKARVDTHWKKQPLGASNANGAVQAKPAEGGVAALLRSNSVRTHTAPSGVLLTRQVSANTLARGDKAAAEATSKLKPKPETGSSDQVNGPEPTLRREDSNLSKKSLTKLRAALGKPVMGVAGLKKEPVGVLKKEPVGVLKKEPFAAIKKDVIGLVRSESTARGALLKPSTTIQPSMSLSSKRLAGIEDIDANDKENLVLVSEYVNDIYDYLYKVEIEQPIHNDHLAGQKEVSHKMRAVLIDWINEVHLQFHLAAETFQLAVAIIDRYLQVVKNTKRSNLQLVGVTALFIATKYEELFPPAINDFVFITDDTYSAREIRIMELQIFKAIDCNLSRPLPIHFLRRYSKAAGAEDEHHAMSKYFVELASVDYDLASYKPSEIAAASLFLSLHLLNGNYRASTGFNDKHWTPTLTYYSRYSATHLRPITRQIAKLARDAPQAKLKAIHNKYQANKFQKIALRTELSGPLMDSIVAQSLKK
ncbi:G2/mitotic-specific cyclin-B isoform X2 [Drosophila obscura]|uniref:G2/mitotic-specific cyclin-B isoform X2 n=1 Tax=Drosophila obscura TaxID=7282 RepID=UPI001BB1F123|nr:G2/mitotic-specific cyclin-B isoform X2 [Drosophila obscura]